MKKILSTAMLLLLAASAVSAKEYDVPANTWSDMTWSQSGNQYTYEGEDIYIRYDYSKTFNGFVKDESFYVRKDATLRIRSTHKDSSNKTIPLKKVVCILNNAGTLSSEAITGQNTGWDKEISDNTITLNNTGDQWTAVFTAACDLYVKQIKCYTDEPEDVVPTEVTITPKTNVTLAVGSENAVEFGQLFDVTPTEASQHLVVKHASDEDKNLVSIEDNKVTPLAAGTVNLTASLAENDSYSLAAPVTGQFTVSTPTGIRNVVVEAEGAVEFFDMQGRRVAMPCRGLYIRRQGSVATVVRF